MGAYYNEIDPKAAAWLRELIKRGLIAQGEVDERSILEVQPGDLAGFTQCHFFAGIGVWSYALRSAGWADDRPVWTGSCPCQPFSAAGKGDEFADERHLWPAWFALARELRPDAIFGEQVSSKDALSWFDHVRSDLEGEGYALGVLDTCAAGVGAPHIRQRLYFVAESNDTQRRPDSTGRNDSGRYDTGRSQGASDSEGCGSIRKLADSDGWNASAEREQRSGEQRLLAQGGGIDKLGHAQIDGREVRIDLHGELHREGLSEGRESDELGNPSGRGLGIERDAAQQGSGGHADGAERLGVLDNAIGGRSPGSDGGTARKNGEQRVPPQAGATGDLVAIARLGTGDDRRTRIEFVGDTSNARPPRAGSDAQSGGQVGQPSNAGGEVHIMGDAEIIRCEGRPVQQETGRPTRGNTSSATNGFWANAEWIPCRDGKARPTEPGTFPLVTGAPARVVRLRGYGNAINAEQARHFVEAFIEVNRGGF